MDVAYELDHLGCIQVGGERAEVAELEYGHGDGGQGFGVDGLAAGELGGDGLREEAGEHGLQVLARVLGGFVVLLYLIIKRNR